MAIEVFNRCEKKYLLDKEQYQAVTYCMQSHMVPDLYNRDNEFYQISNIYYDTWDDRLIRSSIEKPVYKEKLRLRAYGTPKLSDEVFVEIKKKYDGIVNKRRTGMSLEKAYGYLGGTVSSLELEVRDKTINRQVMGEIDYFKSFYSLVPKVYLSYDRMAYFEKDDGDFRVTFDTNITSRRHNLRLELGSFGEKILPPDIYLMEIKINRAVPMWFTKIISELKIYPVSFSKYGTEYKRYVARTKSEEAKREGKTICLNQFLQAQQIIPSALAHQCQQSWRL